MPAADDGTADFHPRVLTFADGWRGDREDGHGEHARTRRRIIANQLNSLGILMGSETERSARWLYGFDRAEVNVAVLVVRRDAIEFTAGLLLDDRQRQRLGVLVIVAHLADEFATDMIGDRVVVGFILRRVDRGADAELLAPFWKRLRLDRVKNPIGPKTKALFSGIFQKLTPENVDDCRKA